MSDPELIDFQKCLEQASQLVSAYRAQVPEGCDPQNTWVAVGTLVVSDVVARSESGDWFGASGGIFGSKEEAQAAGGAGGKGKGAFAPLAIPEPAEIEYASPEEVLSRWRGDITTNIGAYSNIAGVLNMDEQNAARTANQMANPNYYGLLANLSNKATDYANGNIPTDVRQKILTGANEQSYLRGFSYGTNSGSGGNVYAGGNDAGANLALKNLGLTSLDLSKFGLSLTNQALEQSRASRGRIISATDVIPTQGFFADQMNKQSEGAYMNEQNANDYSAAVKNAPQQAAYQQLLYRNNMVANNQAASNAQSNANNQQMMQVAQLAMQAYGSYKTGGATSAASTGLNGSGSSVGSTINASGGGTTLYTPKTSQTAGSYQPTTSSTTGSVYW